MRSVSKSGKNTGGGKKDAGSGTDHSPWQGIKEEVEEDAGLIVSDDEQHFPHPKLRSRSYLPVKWTEKTLSCLQLSKEKMFRFFPLSNMW